VERDRVTAALDNLNTNSISGTRLHIIENARGTGH
jgi:hypothetical protein